jgi:CDP-glycerol glycerophosphotransferase (TagB/SpsB family)
MKQFKDAITYYHIDPDFFSIYEIGFPKLDNVLSDKIQKTELLKLRNFSLSKKTILYAPSWDEGLSLKRFGLQIMNTLVRLSDEFNLIIRPHPVLLTREGSDEFEFYTGGIDWLTLLNKYKNVNNLYISTDLDSNYDLVCADLLISDVSSITWDFLLLGKPVLLYSSDEYFSKINPTLYREYGNANLSLDELKNNDLINGGRKHAVLFNNLEELEL